MYLKEKFFLSPSPQRRWQEVKHFVCLNPKCGCNKVMINWQTTEGKNQYETYKNDWFETLEQLRAKAIYIEHKVQQGSKGGMMLRYGENISTTNPKTGLTTFTQYAVDFNGTKEQVKIFTIKN